MLSVFSNLENFDKWSKNDDFIKDLITMLDNVLQHYIDNAIDTTQLGEYSANFKRFQKYVRKGKEGYTKSAYSAYRERSLGLGAMGFHAYLCLLYTSPSPRDGLLSRMPSSA